MYLYNAARKLNQSRKAKKKALEGRWISPVRRIERVHPIKGERLCAMTFDDGPCRISPFPETDGEGTELTKYLADQLLSYGARATFDVIGDTSRNYPDTAGEEGKFYWGGIKYDHYPDIGHDLKGGARNCPKLMKYLVENGFEISNHGDRHILFGRSFVYYKRKPFKSFDDVLADIKGLDDHVFRRYGYKMSLARPPHYIDRIAGGMSAYDAYEILGYNYMAASFDGGGWMPQNCSGEEEAEKMVSGLRSVLEADPEALNGQIIFQKDGYNMSRKTPVADALPKQLALLSEYGYRVVGVEELIRRSPFSDLDPAAPCAEAVRGLLERKLPVAFRDNTFRADAPLLFSEACAMLAPEKERLRRIELKREGKTGIGGVGLHDLHATAYLWAVGGGLRAKTDAPVTSEMLSALLKLAGYKGELRRDKVLTHADAAEEIFQNILLKEKEPGSFESDE